MTSSKIPAIGFNKEDVSRGKPWIFFESYAWEKEELAG